MQCVQIKETFVFLTDNKAHGMIILYVKNHFPISQNSLCTELSFSLLYYLKFSLKCFPYLGETGRASIRKKHSLEHLLKVEKASIALNVQLVEYFSCFSTQVQPQFVIAIKSTQNVLLDVTNDVCLAQVIQRNLTKAGKKPSD